ncbi:MULTISPECIES: response regulator transcription factor [unclassified Pseudomonas]|uniref:response regulator transcription factor n=1 Tax=unclassified Pseudomonas TaxID=196821 RepID=UPI00119A348F|nr:MULTISPECIES: response regulator [unclassified Pseudomonas]TWC13420.1 response regulator receiver domain-containing protein [Pseudomonas sp. SJZ075]TWC17846.1 response regulator receiver domain-containing protein [Pseudomonas sp. SJZ074]TWC29718.1 response regulator receiver domain-containing protein [Pseudomonas sp. SJZ078]TWC35764.1 response regulator receiver domain-containing protein [Pseudomonas sp. SJZ085]TWC50404.1 response regulator receiver domain-containing protein [Pseudomonas sp
MEDTQLRNTQTIAVVDDDESVRAALKSLLRSSGYAVRTYCSALDFLDNAGPAGTNCLVSDIQMPGMSGVELHERLGAMGFRIPTIFITAYPGKVSQLGVGTPGLIACLPKPCEADQLLECIETALSQRH